VYSNSNTTFVETIDNELVVSHRVIAEQTNNKVLSVQKLITENISELEEFGKVRFKLKVVRNSKNRVNEEKSYFLNEQQTNFVFILAKIPKDLSFLFAKYGSSFKALEEFSKVKLEEKSKYFVYIANFEKANLKIGFTSSLKTRLRTLETQSGNKILNQKIFKFLSKVEALTCKKFLHQKFADFRTRGEYFSITFTSVLRIIESFKECNKFQ
jgi:phage regulator Rha-like protein